MKPICTLQAQKIPTDVLEATGTWLCQRLPRGFSFTLVFCICLYISKEWSTAGTTFLSLLTDISSYKPSTTVILKWMTVHQQVAGWDKTTPAMLLGQQHEGSQTKHSQDSPLNLPQLWASPFMCEYRLFCSGKDELRNVPNTQLTGRQSPQLFTVNQADISVCWSWDVVGQRSVYIFILVLPFQPPALGKTMCQRPWWQISLQQIVMQLLTYTAGKCILGFGKAAVKLHQERNS